MAAEQKPLQEATQAQASKSAILTKAKNNEPPKKNPFTAADYLAKDPLFIEWIKQELKEHDVWPPWCTQDPKIIAWCKALLNTALDHHSPTTRANFHALNYAVFQSAEEMNETNTEPRGEMTLMLILRGPEKPSSDSLIIWWRRRRS